jgi:hypothetical protein
MSKIFICYRRADSQSATGRIYDHLVQAFGKNAVFIDVDNIPAGVDFRAAIDQTIQQSAVMLVVIGPSWLMATDANGRRLDQVNDRVRIEVESALLRRMPVIPVLVDGARMPEARELPPTLMQLAYQNSREVQPNPHFQMDINRLIDSIAQLGVPRITTGAVVNPPQVYQPAPPAEQNQTDVARNDLATSSLIWGLVSFVFSWVTAGVAFPLTFPAAIFAILRGNRALKLARMVPFGTVDTRSSRTKAMIGVTAGYLVVGLYAIVAIGLVFLLLGPALRRF